MTTLTLIWFPCIASVRDDRSQRPATDFVHAAVGLLTIGFRSDDYVQRLLISLGWAALVIAGVGRTECADKRVSTGDTTMNTERSSDTTVTSMSERRQSGASFTTARAEPAAPEPDMALLPDMANMNARRVVEAIASTLAGDF